MPILKRCWSPFMLYPWSNVRYGSFYCAIYSAVLHLLFICYAIYVINGGRSEDFYTPYFELTKRDTLAAGIFTIIYSHCFLIAVVMLIFGIRMSNRCLFYPWMIGIALEITFIASVGLWCLIRYYHNPFSLIAAFVFWLFDALYVYCLLCVISQYQVIQDLQEPKFLILYP